MQTHTHNGGGKTFITILADGKFHQSVDEGTPGAVVREYEDKDKVMQKKTELVFDSVSGIITGIAFEDGEYGKTMKLTIDNDGVVSVGTTSNFGEDIMKKLPALDISQEVLLTPYSFTDDKGKNRKGVTVTQNDVKVESFYYDKDKKKATNKIPQPEGETKDFDSDDWKMYFMKVRKFLIAETEKIAANLKPVEIETDIEKY